VTEKLMDSFDKACKEINGFLLSILFMEEVEYHEWVPMGALVKGLIVMVTAVFVVVTLAVFLFAGFSVENLFGVLFGWAIMGLIFFVFWNYRGLSIRISGERLTVEYGLFNKKSFLLQDIVSCKRTRVSFGSYLGVGVRYGLDGSIAYTTSFGDAVEVAPKVGRTFVFSSNGPDRVCNAIKRGNSSEEKRAK